jgi:DNA-binding Lrp family transcriptional regulator
MKRINNTPEFVPRDDEELIMKKIQGDIPLAPRPFLEIARQAGSSEADVIAAVRKLKQDKVIRKFGAVLRHQKAGFSENAILMISAEHQAPERIGEALASFREISHCYQREPQFMGRYGIFAMVHAGDGELEGVLRNIVGTVGTSDYIVLASAREFKKTSLEPV